MSDTRRIALTFDAEHPDRPRAAPGNADRILDALDQAGIRATFFVQGRWAEAYPVTAARIARDGHAIGNHSHHHARMPLLHDEGIAADVLAAQEAIGAATGVDPRPWFRMPFGAGHDDRRVLDVLDDLGYTNVHWDLDVEDWEPWRTAEDVTDDIVRGVSEDDRRVPLLHTWPDGTADAIGAIVRRIADIGVGCVGIDELGAALP
jgi:peptidoglycan/xylan/chitin deacetylase (PgdA/CDA1 family)